MIGTQEEPDIYYLFLFLYPYEALAAGREKEKRGRRPLKAVGCVLAGQSFISDLQGERKEPLGFCNGCIRAND